MQVAQVPHDLADPLALGADVEGVAHRLLDLVVVAALTLAVLAEHVQLVVQLGAGKEVAGLGIAGHQTERLALAGAADEYRRVGPAQRLRRVEGPLRLDVRAGERTVVAAPHLQADPELSLIHIWSPKRSISSRVICSRSATISAVSPIWT